MIDRYDSIDTSTVDKSAKLMMAKLPKLISTDIHKQKLTSSSSNVYLKAQYRLSNKGQKSSNQLFPLVDKVLELSSARQSGVNTTRLDRSRVISEVDKSFLINLPDSTEVDGTMMDMNSSRLQSNNQSSLF